MNIFYPFPQSQDLAIAYERTMHNGAAPVELTYSERVLALNPIAYFILSDSSGSTAANAEGTTARDGTYYNGGGDPPTLGVPGIGDGNTAIQFNSDGGVMTYYTDSIRDTMLNTTFTLVGWSRVNSAAIWSDGISRRLLKHGTGNDNRLIWARTTNDSQLRLEYYADGIQYIITHSDFNTTDWFHWVIVVNKPNILLPGTLQLYINGLQISTDTVLLTNFTGTLENVSAVIGADNVFGAFNWHGRAAHFALFNTALTAEQITEIAVI